MAEQPLQHDDDEILQRAEALLRRHRGVAQPVAPTAPDVPLLTDAIEIEPAVLSAPDPGHASAAASPSDIMPAFPAMPAVTAPSPPAAELAKSFEPAAIEARWYPFWEENGYFRTAPDDGRAPYCIQLPPPNVTGTLHMGHAFQQTLMDALVRYHRMCGRNVNWVVGTDHAGIATQIVVERQLQARGMTRHDLGRAAFVERVWEWKQESGSTITRQMRRMGASANWGYADTEGQNAGYFTMDAKMSRAVVEVFVRLYEEGLIYRGKRLVNWDPVLGTAVSDLEVDSEEEDGRIWEIRYPIEDGSGDARRGNHAARNHARRRRGGRESRGPALPLPPRQAGKAAAHRAGPSP